MRQLVLLLSLCLLPVLALGQATPSIGNGTGTPTGTASGDLSGTYPSPQVAQTRRIIIVASYAALPTCNASYANTMAYFIGTAAGHIGYCTGTVWADVGYAGANGFNSTSATVTADGFFYTLDATANSQTVTLPACPSNGANLPITFVRTDATANTITLSGAQTIDGAASYALQGHQGLSLMCNGSEWKRVRPPPFSCTLNAAATATCTVAVPASCNPTCSYKSSTVAHTVACDISGTTVTAVSGTANDAGAVNVSCP